MFGSGKWGAALVAGLAHGLLVLAIPSTTDLDICPIVGGFELDPAATKRPLIYLNIPGSQTCVTIDYGDQSTVDDVAGDCNGGNGSQQITLNPGNWNPPQQIALPPFFVPIWVQSGTVVPPPADCVAANTVPPA